MARRPSPSLATGAGELSDDPANAGGHLGFLPSLPGFFQELPVHVQHLGCGCDRTIPVDDAVCHQVHSRTVSGLRPGASHPDQWPLSSRSRSVSFFGRRGCEDLSVTCMV